MASHPRPSSPPFGQSQDLHAWISAALAAPFNPVQSTSLQSIIEYNTLAGAWNQSFLANWSHYEIVKSLDHELLLYLPLGPEAIVLDLGGATGILACQLVESGLARKVISVDISPNMTQQAHQSFESIRQSFEQQNQKSAPWELVAVCADMTRPVENQPQLQAQVSDGIDVVVSLHAFSSLAPAAVTGTLETMRKLLRPGGRILINNAPPRPFLRHVVCIPSSLGVPPNPHPQVAIENGLVGRSTLVCDPESSALVQLQKASFEHLARESGLTLLHTTPGALPEGARNVSTEFLQYIRHRLRNGTPSYDELTAPPQQLFELMGEAWRHLVAKYDTELNDMWSEAGVDVA